MTPPIKIETERGPVSIRFDGPPDAAVLVVLAHGAGSGMDSEFMSVMTMNLANAGVRVVRFNFPYIEKGRKAPDPQASLVSAYRLVVDGLAEERVGCRLVLGGKSLGGRIASHVVAEGADVDGLVFHGYPLHPPGKPERIRDAHLHAIKVPMLFVEGTRDPFCPLPTLENVMDGLEAPTELVVIDDGDHSFKVRKSSGRSTHEAWAEAAAATASFVSKL